MIYKVNISNNAGKAIRLPLPIVDWDNKFIFPNENLELVITEEKIKDEVYNILNGYSSLGLITFSITHSDVRNSFSSSQSSNRMGPVTLNRVKIIHISDLHFSTETANNGVDDKEDILNPDEKQSYSSFSQFIRHIEKQHYSGFDKIFLVITGDLVDKGDILNFSSAKKFIIKCIKALGIESKHVIIVPGNHDVLRTKNEHQQLENFKNEFKEFCTPFSDKPYADIPVQLLIYTLNSNRLIAKRKINFFKNLFSKDKYDFTETPAIGNIQLDRLRGFISKSNHAVRIVALHHHLVPVWGIESKAFDPILDAGVCINELQENGFVMALHGHKHQRSFKFIQSLDVPSASGLYITGTGSFGSDRMFNEIDIIFYDVGHPKILHQCFQLNNNCAEQIGKVIDCTPRSIAIEQEELVSFHADIDLEKK